MRVYLPLVKLFTSFAVFRRRPKSPGTTMMPSSNPTGPPGGPSVPPKAIRLSSKQMTGTKRPRTRHRVKPFKVG
jgi:hypothetical protein